jgi:hypothetical protein
MDPFGLIQIDGMDCKEISRKEIPTLSSNKPISVVTGTRVICTGFDISDSLTCTCTGRREKIITDYFTKYISWEVEYKCCSKTCPKSCTKKTKIEDYSTTTHKNRYEPLPGEVVRWGTTGGNFGYCSACMGGVGSPM